MFASFALLQAVEIGFAAIVLVIIAIFAALVVISAIKIVKEYERGVIFRLGRVQGRAKGPGLFILLPFVDKMVKIDLRTVTMDVPPQDIITRDNVPARVNAVVYFRVVDPNRSVIEVENHVLATSQISQTTLRSVLGQKDLDDLLTNREQINSELQSIIDEQTDPWGVKVSVVEVKDVEIPSQMQRAMARQAESERERRAKIIAAEGEFQASERLRQAADRLESPHGFAVETISDDGRDSGQPELHHRPARPHRPPRALPRLLARRLRSLGAEERRRKKEGREGGPEPLRGDRRRHLA
jgi:regulator of protease activity HflC (stomatin/prohibitin superfamily)